MQKNGKTSRSSSLNDEKDLNNLQAKYESAHITITGEI